jgi:hypothetical protein
MNFNHRPVFYLKERHFGDCILSPKRRVQIKVRMMDNVQNCGSYIILPTSRNYRLY